MDKELLSALLSVQPGGYPTPNSQWRFLFDYYNKNLKTGDHLIGMGCRPCFDKVYQHCRTVLLGQLLELKNSQNQIA
jgi:hypothetical protein